MPTKSPLQKLTRITLLILFYGLFIAAALEFGLRWLAKDSYQPPGLDSPNIWQFHTTYGWSGKPNIDSLFRQNQFSIQVHHNSLGFRGREYSAERNEKKRMLVLGDSFVWCYGVEQKECFVDQLEASHANWEIINAGLAGSGTDQQYLILKDLIEYYKPDVVLLLVIQNDFQDNLAEENHFYYKPFFTLVNGELIAHQIPVPSSRIDQSLERWVYGRSYLFGIGGFVRQIILNYVRPLLGLEPLRFEPYRDFNFRKSIEITQTLISAMGTTSREHNAQFILLHGQMLDFLHKSLEDVATKNNIPLHNLDSAFTGYVHKQYQIPDDAHWNALGHQLVAEDIEPFLTEIGIFNRP